MPYESKLLGSTLVVAWDRPDLADVRNVVSEVAQARRRVGQPLLYVAYIPDATATPEAPVRDAMSRSMPELLESCESIVFVLEGSGFKVSIGRAALAGIMLASGHRGRVHVTGSIGQAAAKVPPEVLTHLHTVRARRDVE